MQQLALQSRSYTFLHSYFLCRLDTFEVIVQIGLIMGQLITRFTRGVEKRDINLEYQTPGDGNAYAIDGNDEYQPSDNDEVEERNAGVRTQRFSLPKVGMIL